VATMLEKTETRSDNAEIKKYLEIDTYITNQSMVADIPD
jgi:hypothetical protein